MSKAECGVEGCNATVHARGLCHPHYRKAWQNGTLPVRPPRRATDSPAGPASVPSVVAEVAWPDVVRGGPTGQRLALYKCPACRKRHLVAWLPIDANPGLKTATCRVKSATGKAPIPVLNVLAPPASGMLDGPPEGYRPLSKARVTSADLAAAAERADAEAGEVAVA